ncbi:MAG: hypothetical protein NVSMB46_05280 [Candidatus Saccharimonadales bacterium]
MKDNMSKEGRVNRFSAKRILATLVYIIVLVGLAAFGGFYFTKYQDLKNNPPTADQVAKIQLDKTIANVGKLYALPQGEKPTFETVTDKSQLKNQAFFAKAENGDITLIYPNAKLAILYRPSTKKLVNVSTVTTQSNLSVSVIGKLADRQNIESILTTDKIVFTDNGDTKGTYQGVTVIDVSGQHGPDAQAIATALHGQVGSLPLSETKPLNVDVLIIAGSTVVPQP